MQPAKPKKRRTQADRTASTKKALIEATIRVLNRVGYTGTTTALIAEEAGTSRGAILHQFGTRLELMVEVVKRVYENELRDYGPLLKAEPHQGHRISEFPEVIWGVLSRPAGVAVLEIFLGARSDADLAKRIRPTQIQIERDGMKHVRAILAVDEETLVAAMRLIVWSARGLSLAQTLVEKPEELRASVLLLRRLFELAESAGQLPQKATHTRPSRRSSAA